MTKSKRLLAAILAGLMSVTALTACKSGDTSSSGASKGGDSDNTSDGGKVLNIYCWNDEFKRRVTSYAQDVIDEFTNAGGTVNWIETPNAENAYQNRLDGDLMNQEYINDDEKIDIFLVEADYALKYVNKGITADVKDLGLTDDDLSQMYQYTKDIMTDTNGKLKGVSWQATPGLYAYRRTHAKTLWGTDEPTEVQTKIDTWEKFEAEAALAADKGIKMLSGYDDAYRAFSNNASKPWVDSNKNVVIDEALEAWITQTKTFTEKGYNNKTSLWSDPWAADQGPNGKVLGFFYSTWGIDFTLSGNSLANPLKDKDGNDTGAKAEVGNGAYGDWATTYGPASYYWGGTWICAYSKTDNKEVIAKLMKKLCVDGETMKKITTTEQDYTNNIAAMKEIANSDFKSDFLGGQNHIALFATVAEKIKMDNTTAYDQGLNESFQGAMKAYFDETLKDDKTKTTKEDALKEFYKNAKAKYPDLVVPQ